MAARLNPRHCAMVREKIQTSQLINRLQNEALGKIELTNGQRDSAKYLITQAIGSPAQSIAIDATVHDASELSDAELTNIAQRGRERAITKTNGKEKPAGVH